MKKILSFILALMMIVSCFSMITVTAEGEITGEFKGATLNLGSTFTLDYYVTSSVDVSELQMKFISSSGRVTTASGEYDSAMKMYKFSYTEINPQCMTDTINAELYYGETKLAEKLDYSVKAYCENQIKKTAKDLGYNAIQFKAFRTLLANMLIYGGASQQYKDYNVEMLANTSSWIAVYQGTFGVPSYVKTISGNKDDANKVKSVGLRMANANKIYFKLVLTDDVTITLNGELVSKSSLKKNADGTYMLYTEDVKATEFDKVYTVALTKGNSVISEVSYNVNAYIASKYQEANVADIVKALHNYGASAEAYKKAMLSSEGGDFDLNEEDDLTTAYNYIPALQSNLNEAPLGTSLPANWGGMGGNAITVSVVEDGYTGNCIHVKYPENNTYNYYTAQLDLKPYITKFGAYEISFKYKVKGATGTMSAFYGAVRTDSQTSFTGTKSPFYAGLKSVGVVKNDVWHTYSDYLYVRTDDLDKGGTWKLSLHQMDTAITDIYIDDVTVTKAVFKDEPQAVTSAQTWVKNEVVLISDTWYEDAFYEVDVDLKLTNGTTTYTIPAFWDGDNTWRARFVCPTAGTWTYTSVCSDTNNKGLHNVTNTFECTNYSGNLDIYKHGFVKTLPNTKYFVYNDGTPFFYLGDTHWNLGAETTEVTNTVADKRAEQGYTVWQSEPLGASFNFENGVTTADIKGLRAFDEKFEYIASKGFVHANASHFFPSAINGFILNHGGYAETPYATKLTLNGTEYSFYDLSDEAKLQLEKICRYWVARYSAYPVMWTLGQEVDNDFYWQREGHLQWSYVNNPYRYVAEYINKHDPYKSPLTGHQEYASASATSSASDGVLASTSAFRDVTAHTWYGVQWSPNLKGGSNATIARDFWNNGQGKPVVNYEGRYCYLWTKHYGARAQGWLSFLNGMFGHGYGAQDTWCYLSSYSEDVDTDDGVDKVTAAQKQAATWQDALEYESSYQLGYMKKFFTETVVDWYNLIPRFDDNSDYFQEAGGAYATVASNANNTKIVIYFSNFSDTSLVDTTTGGRVNSANYGTATGWVKKLAANAPYTYMWFNPVTGKIVESGTFTSNYDGMWKVPNKATCDMVLYIRIA